MTDTQRQAEEEIDAEAKIIAGEIGVTHTMYEIYRTLAVREREEREKAERKAELMKKAADRYLPCPDHRDKVNTAETGCPYCANEATHKLLKRETEEGDLLWEKNKTDLETLAKTMIACELATGHGEDIDSLCLELRTQWEELSSKYISEREKNKEMEDALKEAIHTIRIWHGMGEPKAQEKFLWKVYSEQSPEMKRILSVPLSPLPPEKEEQR